jgi:hypothetical protein
MRGLQAKSALHDLRTKNGFYVFKWLKNNQKKDNIL